MIAWELRGSAMARQFDTPWKETLDLLLERVLLFFFPDVHAGIDWSRGYQALDPQLHEIVRDAELGPTLADRLFQVYTTDGEDVWILIHLEVQAQPVADFPKRM